MHSDTVERVAVAEAPSARPAMPDAAERARPRWRADATCLLVLAAAFVVPLLIVSPVASFPLIDDWNTALSVQRLRETGELDVSEWTAMTLIFQIAWGWLFTTIFGFSFTVLRASTLVLSLLGSVSLYALCRQLDITPPRALAGALLFWANPIVFSLSYTFMSDVPAVSLQIMATLGYVYGVRRDSYRGLFVGSCFAALAFLIRQPGILLPVALLAYGLLDRWPREVLVRRSATSALVPLLAAIGYAIWSQQRGVPETQAQFTETFLTSGPSVWPEVLLLTGYLLIYTGACLLPLALACGVDGLRTLARGRSARRTLLLGWAGGVTALVVTFVVIGGRNEMFTSWMPYLQFGAMFQAAGIGPDNLRGVRPVILTDPMRIALTILSAASLFVIGALLVRYQARRGLRGRQIGAADLVVLIGLSQFAAGFAVSAHLLKSQWLTFDRYFLPVLPPLIVLGLLAVRDIRVSRSVLSGGLAVFMLFSIAGTHDWLSFHEQRWEVGEMLVAEGVPLEQIDAGMEWDGWFLYEESQVCCADEPRTPLESGRPFWTEIIAQATDSTWVLSSTPLPGHRIRERFEYDTWLRREPTRIYLLERRETSPVD